MAAATAALANAAGMGRDEFLARHGPRDEEEPQTEMLRRECEEEQRLYEAWEATQIQSLGPSHWGPGEMQCPLADDDPEGKGDPKGKKDPKGKGKPKGKDPKGEGRSESSA